MFQLSGSYCRESKAATEGPVRHINPLTQTYTQWPLRFRACACVSKYS